MAGKAPLDSQALKKAIQAGYGFEVRTLEFLLRGFGGDCYRVEDRDGQEYFLKMHDPFENQMTAASSMDFYLPLMYQLVSRGILSDIPHVVKTLAGELSLKLGEFTLVVTDFIKGELVGFVELPEEVLKQLAKMVGILHGSRGAMEFEHPFIEQFEIVFEDELLESFGRLAGFAETATAGQKRMRGIVLPREGQIKADLEKLKSLQASVRKADKAKVVCHTDLHGGNLMKGRDGRLYILDWENALIAPPEQDLFFFAGEWGFWEVFWPHYQTAFPEASVNPDLLRFYFYRRALEDAADLIFRILRRAEDPERDVQELIWLGECLDGMTQIEETVGKIERRLGG